MEQELKNLSKMFDILSNEVRLCILFNLCLNGEKKVGDLQTCANSSQSFVSQQLSKLKDLGIIVSRKEGTEVYYSICDERISQLIKLINTGGLLSE